MKAINIRTLMKGQIEVILEVERNDCLITNTLPMDGFQIERLSIGTRRTIHRVSGHDNEEAIRVLNTAGFRAKRAGNSSLWVESASCSSCSFFSKTFSNIMGTRSAGRYRVQYRVLLPSPGDLRSLEKQLKAAGLSYDIISVISYNHHELTDREREILRMAMDKGYFEDSGRISLTKLARELDISPSSLSEILRRSLKKSVSFYMDRKP
ncbi:MAG: helix-turn-helix domain-containing protein [Candidatus Thermoplasmatota archaeon]|nr:helix-turn-helix domain-containing protein [Candidatus Thermoplasmatota archaeon]MCL5786046.1 helix-turn-helix domain-containing protein [Candidatus Thermoplasmatota archaeon]